MKLTKKQNIIISIVFVLLVIVGTVSLVFFGRSIHESYALGLSVNNASVTNGSDIVSIRATAGSSPIAGFYVGTSDNINEAAYYPYKNTIATYVSLLNGSYNVWVKDQAGNVAKYNKKVNVTRSCTSNFINNAKGSGEATHCYFTADGKYLEETRSELMVTCANGYQRNASKTRVVKDTCSSLSASDISGMGLTKKVCSKVWTYSCEPTSAVTNNTLGVISATVSNDWSNSNKEIVVTSNKGANNIAGYYISTNSARPNGSAGWNESSSTTWSTSQPAGTYYIWVKDTAGHISDNYKSVTVSKIETTAPSINSVVPSSVNKSLTISASDDGGSGIAGYYVSTENNAPNLSSEWINTTDANYTVSKDAGTYYIWAKDAAGNISSSKKAKIAKSSNTDNNLLSSLGIKGIDISPKFDPNTTKYTAISQVSKIVVDAALQDSNSSFVKKYGPRTVNLKSGDNKIVIKVKSSLGNVKKYVIKVTYGGKSSANVSSRLKSLKLNSGNLTFDPDITEYRMYVPKSLEKLEITAIPEDDNAEVKVENPEKLEVGDNKVSISVVATDGTFKIYNLKIIKKDTEEISTNNYLQSLTISGYDIKFNRNKQSYSIKLGHKNYLNINAVAEDSNAEVTIDNTKNLTKNSVVKVMVRAEDGSARIYSISLNKSRITVFHVILIIIFFIIALLAIAYLILRLMGYSVYINFGLIKDYFSKLFKKNNTK